MRRLWPLPALLAAGLGIGPGAPAASALYATESFETSYAAYAPSGGAPWAFRVKVYVPTVPGAYPIAIVLGGAGTCPDPPTCSVGYGTFSEAVAQDAAARGIVAAIAHYDSAKPHFCGCTGAERFTGFTPEGLPMACDPPFDGWDDKARATFDNADPRSALRRIVAATAGRPARASLAKGIVVIGHSQGSWVARLADRYTRAGTGGRAVAGALLTGTGIWGYGAALPRPYPVGCNRFDAPGVVPGDRVRALDGARDDILGANTRGLGEPPLPLPYPATGTRLGARRSLYAVTGLCPARHATIDACLSAGPGGGGWRVVLPGELTPGYGGADHAFMAGRGGSLSGPIDPRWRQGWPGEPTSPPVSLKGNLNWLARRLGGGVLQVP